MNKTQKTLISILAVILVAALAYLGIQHFRNRNVLPGLAYKKESCIFAYKNNVQQAYFRILGSDDRVLPNGQKATGYKLQIYVFDTAWNLKSNTQTTATEKTLSGMSDKIVECPSQVKALISK